MKLSSIKKKYPKAWAEFEKKHSGISAYEGYLHNVDIRDWYSSIVDHFDKLGLVLDSGMSITDESYLIFIHTFENNCHIMKLSQIYEQVYGKEWEHFESRNKAETAGLSKLFEIRETQLKKVPEKQK